MALQVSTTFILAKASEYIFDDKFSYAFIPEGIAIPETPSADCGGAKAATSIFILGHMSNGI
jgi:hypothetical protein